MRSAAACGARDRSAHPAGRGRDYEPVRGGFFAVIPSSGEVPPCATDAADVAGNAFYCSTEDVVAWDAENLLPELRDKYGDFVIPVVLAHEWVALFYCVADDYVGWDNVGAMPEVYRRGGDYAVATLLATQYGLAALTWLGKESDEKTSTLRGDCLAGGYTASVIIYNRPDTSTYHISPGDLDEGIKALMVFRGEGDTERQGAGFARVRAFREGVMDGAEARLDYQA